MDLITLHFKKIIFFLYLANIYFEAQIISHNCLGNIFLSQQSGIEEHQLALENEIIIYTCKKGYMKTPKDLFCKSGFVYDKENGQLYKELFCKRLIL